MGNGDCTQDELELDCELEVETKLSESESLDALSVQEVPEDGVVHVREREPSSTKVRVCS